jgi:hypothetical protein
LKGASIVAIEKLPHSPESGALDDYCEDYRAEQLTAVGKQVASLGWIVSSEAPLGRFHVVTFASGFSPGTSSMCEARNSNIGIFEGSKLVALAYTAPSTSWKLGKVEVLESGGLLIAEGGWTGPPVGELRVEDGGLRLSAIEPQSSYCQGRAIVPNAYGRPIEEARRSLIASGWVPVPASDREAGSEVTELLRRGVVETDACAGTGAGYCDFSYKRPAGTLGVTTIGDDHRVVGYGVECAAK